MRCKNCLQLFDIKRFNQKTCSNDCEKEYKKNNTVARSGYIARVSNNRMEQEKTYTKQREIYLALKPNCEKCGKEATDIHHKNGRNGARLNDVTYFMSVCRLCHGWIHTHPIESRENKWLK